MDLNFLKSNTNKVAIGGIIAAIGGIISKTVPPADAITTIIILLTQILQRNAITKVDNKVDSTITTTNNLG